MQPTFFIQCYNNIFYGLTKLIGEEHIYASLPDVLEAYRKENKLVETEPSD